MTEPARDQERRRILNWCLGNTAAADMVERLFLLSQFADDIVDGDSQAPSRDMVKALHLALVDLPANAFWRAHADKFGPVVSSVLLDWDASNSFAQSDNEISRMHAYVLREAGERVLFHAALLIGGIDHAANVRREAMQFYHLDHPETFAEWGGAAG